MINNLIRIAVSLHLSLSIVTLANSDETRLDTGTNDILSTPINTEQDVQNETESETEVPEVPAIGSNDLTREPDVAAAQAKDAKSDDVPSNSGVVEHDIDQKNKRFSQSNITIKVGDTINFINSDSYFHNVYSLSDAAQFDLGSYPKGESKSITFEKPGEVTARCAIHPQMQIDIAIEGNK